VSLASSGRYTQEFAGVDTYCTFMGYPRSGHSLVGSLLDAHPDIIMAHELNALWYVRHGFTQPQIFFLLLERSRRFTESGREWTGYAYSVPNQWNGSFRRLKVIGDKRGGGSSKELIKRPELLGLLDRVIRPGKRFIHVVRNPWDNISTMSARSGRDLAASITEYFALCAAVARARDSVEPEHWMDLRYEDLVAKPTERLRQLCAFLGQPAADDYLSDCASIVFASPKQSRHRASWSEPLIDRVRSELQPYDFLHGYDFEG
jgi:hypothetical protein